MSAGVHAEAIKGTFVVGEEWRDSKIKISQLADILPGNPQSPAKMVHSRNTEWCVIAEEVWEDQKMCWTLNWEPGFSRCKSTRSILTHREPKDRKPGDKRFGAEADK